MTRSRQTDHDWVNSLENDPYTGRPLSPLRRQQMHAAVDEQWNKIKAHGARQLKSRNTTLDAEEQQLISRYESLGSFAAEAVGALADGDMSVAECERLLNELDRHYGRPYESPEQKGYGIREAERQYLERVEANSSEPRDPEEFAAGQLEEMSRTTPELRRYGRDPFNAPLTEEAS